MAERSSTTEGGTAEGVRDLDGFCSKIQAMVEMARDEPSFFDKLGECIGVICQAACDHQVRMQAGFISIALSVKVVEGSVLQVDPLCVVAPRAKAVVLREHMRRKGAAVLGSHTAATTMAEKGETLEAELARTDAKAREEQRRILEERAARAK